MIGAARRDHEDDGEGQQRHEDEQDGSSERHLNEGCVDRHDEGLMQLVRQETSSMPLFVRSAVPAREVARCGN